MNTLVTVADWLEGHWQLSAGITVAAMAPPLVYRAVRRAEARSPALAEVDETARKERARTRDRHGRRVEDTLTLGVAAAAAYLSSTGLRKFGKDVMGLDAPLDWLPFVGLDLAALVCGLRARRRARAGKGSGLSGTLFWILIAISALFSASEAHDFIGAVARAAWPLISGVLFELGSLEERLAAKEKLKRELGLWLERKVAAIRMLHPVEWVRVQLALAADEKITQDDATRTVRIERAGHWLYRLRRLQERENKLWFAGPRIGWVDRRAQAAQARVGIQDFGLVLEAVQRRVQTRKFAVLNYDTPAAAQKALGNLIGTSLGQPGTDRRTGTAQQGRTGTAGRPTDGRTGTGHPVPESCTGTAVEVRPDRTGTEPARTGTESVRTAAVPDSRTDDGMARTGTDSEASSPRTGPEDDARYGRTAQVGAGTVHPAGTDTAPTGTDETGTGTDEADTGTDIGTDEADIGTDGDDGWYDLADGGADAGTDERDSSERTDEELVHALREALGEDGKFGTGGIGKTAEHFGIGRTRAKRLMDQARELGPFTEESGTDPDEASGGDAVSYGVATPRVLPMNESIEQARPVSELLSQPPVMAAATSNP